MVVKLLSVATALIVGLLAVLFMDVALHSTGALAQEEAEKKNCPAGFYWERLSGTKCVQDRGSLPGNGKIGYTGTSLCEDGYAGVYERRPTTDGKQAPGSDITVFAYLLKCVTPEKYAAMEAAGELPGQTGDEPGGGDSPPPASGTSGDGDLGGVARDAAEQLYEGGGGPSKGTLAGMGAAVTMLLGAASGVAARWGGVGVGSTPGAAMATASAPTAAAPSSQRLADLMTRQKEIEDKLKWSRAKRIKAQVRFLAVRKRLMEVSIKYWRFWRQQKWAAFRLGIFSLSGQKETATSAASALGDYASLENALRTSGIARNKIKPVYAEAKVNLSEWNQQVRRLELSLKEVQTELRGHRKP